MMKPKSCKPHPRLVAHLARLLLEKDGPPAVLFQSKAT